MKNFSKKEAIRFGWDAMKRNFWFMVGALLVSMAIQAVGGGIADELGEKNGILNFVMTAAVVILQMLMTMGLIKIALATVDNKEKSIGDLFSNTSLLWKYFLASLLYWLILLGGFLLLIVPGIIWSIKYQFYSYYIVDKGVGPLEALRLSAATTEGEKWDLFVFGALLALINIAGFLALIIGLFAAVPVTMIALAYVYRKLSSRQIPIAVDAQSAPIVQVPPAPIA